MAIFDVVVIGLGVMGSAATSALARRGHRVVGIERFAPGHDRGSSHGRTRMIRLGYFEDPCYVPLARRAYELWRETQALSGRALLQVTGIAEIGPPEGTVVAGTLAAARRHGLAHELLDAQALMARYPALRVPPGYAGVLQPDGGILAVEPAIAAFLGLATAAGATLRSGETVLSVAPRAGGVRVETDQGHLDAGCAVVTAGPWLGALLPTLRAPLRVTRQVFGWFATTQPALFAPQRFPVFLLESSHGIHYGFPLDEDGRVKFAMHHHAGEEVDPDNHDRAISPADEALMRAGIAAHLPAANGRLLAAKTCLYTNTPDGDFILDTLPGCAQIVVASPCSGHGFKFAPVIGEILADLATRGATTHDIARFRLGRLC